MTLTSLLLLASLCVLLLASMLALIACWWLQRSARAAMDLHAAVAVAMPSRLPAGFLVLAPDGELRGPVELATLRAMVIDGRLGEGALARPTDNDDWRPARELAAADEAPALARVSAAARPFAAHRRR